MGRTRLVALAVIAAGVLLIPGCGGDDGDGDGGTSKEDYASEVEAIVPSALDEITSLRDAIQRGESAEEITSKFDETETAFQDSIDELENLDPPDDVADENQELVRALDDFRRAIADVGTELEAGQPGQAVNQFTPRAVAFFNQITDIRERLRNAGVEVGD
jgi:hypothetical protein